MKNRILYRYSVVLFIILSTFSIIAGYIKIPMTILMIAMIFTSFIYCYRSFNNKQTIALLFYGLVLILYIISGSEFITMSWFSQELLIPFSCLCIINVFLYTKDFIALKIITYIGILILLIISIPTVILLQLDPDLIRNSVGAKLNNKNIEDVTGPTLFLSFTVIQAIPFILPFLVFYVKTENKLFYKLLMILFIALEYYILVRASFATPLILATVAIILAFVISNNSKKNSIFLFIVLIVVLSLNKNVLVFSLNSIQPYFENTAIFSKITDINNSIVSEELDGDVSGRGELYDMSLNYFSDNLFFGNASQNQVGGHSFFIDRLAFFGILGTLPFFFFLFYTFKNHYSLIPKETKLYYLIGIFAFILLCFSKNVSGIEPYLYVLVFLPGLAFSISSNKN